jgi:hypothetical protein
VFFEKYKNSIKYNGDLLTSLLLRGIRKGNYYSQRKGLLQKDVFKMASIIKEGQIDRVNLVNDIEIVDGFSQNYHFGRKFKWTQDFLK